MNIPTGKDVQCTVERGELLPPGSGGAEALCGDIRAAAAELGVAPATVSVRVISPYALAAAVTVEGRTLPEIRMDSSDRQLGRDSLQRFARSVATAAKEASER